MLWVYLVIASAAFFAAKDIISKHLLNGTSSLEYSFLYSLIATLVSTPLFIYYLSNNVMILIPLTVLAMVIVGLSEISGFIVRATSLKIGDISVVTPLSRMTPVFVVISEFIVFRESLGVLTLAGIPLVVLGSYIIMLKKGMSLLDPIRNFSKEKAAQLAILSTVIYGFTAPASRYAVRHLTPEIFTYLVYLIMTIGFGLYLKRRGREKSEIKQTFKKQPKIWTLVGTIAIISSYLLFYTYTLVPISKVTPVLQLRVLPPVILGGLYFHETDLIRKTIGTLILIAGVTLVII